MDFSAVGIQKDVAFFIVIAGWSGDRGLEHAFPLDRLSLLALSGPWASRSGTHA
jgi:hypothetical protein